MAEKIKSSTYTLNIQTLTPLHIGSGNTLMKGTDYFVDGDRLGKADLRKLYEIIQRLNIGLERWTNYIEAGKDIFEEELQKRGIKLEDVSKEIIPIKNRKGKELYEFIRNQLTGNPIIPGSSIKGAIRTALLAPVLKEYYKGKSNLVLRKAIKESKGKKYLDKFDTKIIADLLKIDATKNYNPQNDIMKFMKISDAELDKDILSVDLMQVLNMNENDEWYIKNQLTQSREYVEGSTSFKISFDSRFWENNSFGINNILSFTNKVNQHTLYLLEKEFNYFKDDLEDNFIEGKLGELILENLDQLISEFNKIDREKEIIIRMSSGSGWDFMTGGWFKEIADDKDWKTFKQFIRPRRYFEYPFPKSRRLTSDLEFPGFVKISFNTQ